MAKATKIERALISVYDKSGLVELAAFLNSSGISVISSGGTAHFLKKEGLLVTEISSLGFMPEILDGRLKTLDRRIYAGILADRTKASHISALEEIDARPIDLVVVNFYPFLEVAKKDNSATDDLIENIDIGGPAMLRAAAKNYAHVVVLHDYHDYRPFMEHYREHHGTTLDYRQECSQKAFYYSFTYDQNIAHVFGQKLGKSSVPTFLELSPKKALRYGENPHQKAELFTMGQQENGVSIPSDSLSHDKSLSYNNLLDAHAAIWALRCLGDQNQYASFASVVIKHGVPCGAALALKLEDAISDAIKSDELSAYGSILAVSTEFTENCARAVADLFIELIIAPKFSETSLPLLAKKKKLRLIPIPNLMTGELGRTNYRSIFGGMLCQSQDESSFDKNALTVVTKIAPNQDELMAMEFAFRIVKATPSNAIAIANTHHLFGVGAGQQNRILAAEIAINGALSRGFDLKTAAMASDGFFPFSDSLALAHSHGIRLLIQPGGSIRDREIIEHADRLGMSMVFTHRRHFRH